ncbi:universal stress protein [Balneolaceae bacterium ANBcel3]|nr:universal stress protein [Balneolaceae bacterium ANBcel3]
MKKHYDALMENPRIIVPTDFSELSYTAFSNADYMAELLDGSVVPLHVYHVEKDKASFPVAPTTQPKVEEFEEKLEKIASEYISEDRMDPVVVKKGKPWKVIVKESGAADMLVMSTHGRSGFSRLFIGAVAERVVRFSKAPVLLVEKESNIRPLKKVLLTTDFSDNSLSAFDYARSIVKKTQADIHLVHLISMQQFKKMTAFENQIAVIQERLNDWVDEYLADIRPRITAEALPVNSSVHEAIVHLTEQKKYNLVIMSTLGHSGLEYLRLGSTASNVLRLVKTAVLSINPKMQDDISKEVW